MKQNSAGIGVRYGTQRYVRTFKSKNYVVGEQQVRGNGSYFDNNTIYGKLGLGIGTYTGNATLREEEFGLMPHFFATKAITAVQGVMWTHFGMCKGSAVANTAGNIMGVSSLGTGIKIGVGAGANTNAVGYNYMAMCANNCGLTGVKAFTFEYTGTGVARDLDDNDAGLSTAIKNKLAEFGDEEPDYCIIKASQTATGGGVCGVFRINDDTVTSGTKCEYLLSPTASLASGGIESFISNGVHLGTNATVNAVNVKYVCLLLKRDVAGTADFALTSYSGIAGDGFHVDLPFAPNFMFFIPATALSPMMWSSAMTSGNGMYVSAVTVNVSDAVMSSDSYGFVLGNSAIINAPNVRTNVVAIKCDLYI